jgi:TPR repeat protein
MKTIRDAVTEATSSKRATGTIVRGAVRVVLASILASATVVAMPQGKIEPNGATSLSDLRNSAESGKAVDQFTLGNLYHDGHGAPQDYEEAAKWYRKAADQGYPPAQFNLGVMYAKGQGVPKDYMEAVKWYRKAADKGDAQAPAALARVEAGQTELSFVPSPVSSETLAHEA